LGTLIVAEERYSHETESASLKPRAISLGPRASRPQWARSAKGFRTMRAGRPRSQ